MAEKPKLSRQNLEEAGKPKPPAPPRIVHLGVGAFARAHLAWYTEQASDADEWGIVAFTGRGPRMADLLNPQDGLYTLVERREDGDNYQVIGALSEVQPAGNQARLRELVASPDTAIVTFTITEAGYKVAGDGALDTKDPDLREDLEMLAKTDILKNPDQELDAQTVLVRVLVGLNDRRLADGGEIALVPLDNLMQNGDRLETAMTSLAKEVSEPLADWIDDNVSFVSTSIDRITPRTDEALLVEVANETGWDDAAPVATEPFADWVLSGEFPAGRPDWESSGAVFVDEIEPYEVRKLWLLNGAHSLLAYMGLLEGHETVSGAMEDPKCSAQVRAWWDEASRHLPAELDPQAYCEALTERFQNERVVHYLEQIANDGLTKLRQRVAPVAKLEIEAGREGHASAAAIAYWIDACNGDFNFSDALASELDPVLASGSTQALVALLDPELGKDEEFVELVDSHRSHDK